MELGSIWVGLEEVGAKLQPTKGAIPHSKYLGNTIKFSLVPLVGRSPKEFR
jgi:hypothetical protein